VPFFAPEQHRTGDLLLRSWRPGDGEELNRATVASYEHLLRPDRGLRRHRGVTDQRITVTRR
jgi:hypothetical protein